VVVHSYESLLDEVQTVDYYLIVVELKTAYCLVHHLLSDQGKKKFTMRSFQSVCVASLAFSVSAFAPVSFGTRNFQASNLGARAASALSMATEDGGVVITGAAGGVGFAYAGEFMDRGYDVVICDVRDCATAAKALQSRHTNGTVFHTKCDVSDSKAVEKLAEFAKKNLGTVGYWINNAGVNGGRRALRDVPISQVELVVKVNLMGTLLCTKAALDLMAEQVSTSGFLPCQHRLVHFAHNYSCFRT
jgi:hypothetical protein